MTITPQEEQYALIEFIKVTNSSILREIAERRVRDITNIINKVGYQNYPIRSRTTFAPSQGIGHKVKDNRTGKVYRSISEACRDIKLNRHTVVKNISKYGLEIIE